MRRLAAPAAASAGRSVAVVAVVIVLTTGPLYRIRSWWGYDDPLAADAVVVTLGALLSLGAVAVLATNGRWRRIDRPSGLIAVALVGWLALGATWSLDAATTIREALQIGGALAVGAAAAAGAPPGRLLGEAWVGVHAALAWSAVAIVTVQPGTQDRNGDWTGVFFNRNSLALYATLGVLLSVALAAYTLGSDAHVPGASWRRDPRTVVVLGAVGGAVIADIVLIAGSDALTPLVALAAALVVVIALRLGQARVLAGAAADRVAALGVVFAAGTAALAWWQRGRLFGLAGRDAELTGRADLWAVAIEWGWRRPLAGFGYLAAWTDTEFAAAVVERRGRLLPSAHNSFVEAFLGGGLLAVVLLVALFAVVGWRAVRASLTGQGGGQAWRVALLVFVAVENVSETVFVGNHLTVAVLGALAVTPVRRSVPDTARPGTSRARSDLAERADHHAPHPVAGPAIPARR